MKTCAYCGRENSDDALVCGECGTAEFLTTTSASLEGQDTRSISTDLTPAAPKLVVVVGIWSLFLPGLIANLSTLSLVISGALVGFAGVVCFLLSLGGATLCVYVLYRVIKNYFIHKRRVSHQSAAELNFA